MTSDKPEKNKIMRIIRLNVTSSTLRNIRMPSVVPATRGGKLMAKSIKTFDDKSLRESISASAKICIAAMNG